MLRLVYRIQDLNFSALMTIYEEGNRENGDERYPHLSPESRLLLAEQDFYSYLREVFFQTPGSFYAIWEAQDRAVSALRMEPYKEGFLLEALETAPLLRKKGYAKALVNEAMQYMKQKGFCPVYSHIRKGNLASEEVHRQCGFSVHQDIAVYIDGSVNSRSNTWIYW